MLGNSFFRSFLSAFVLCSAIGASATPTSNIVVPIADTLGNREGYLGYTLTGSERLDSRYGHYGAVTLGLLDRFEIGAGHDFLGNGTWSLKASVLEDVALGPGAVAFSVGVMNASGKRVDPYAVGRYDFKGVRVHAGLGRFDGVETGFLGADCSLGRYGVLQADYTGGPAGYLWVAHTYAFGNGLSAQFAVGKPNRGDNSWQHFGYLGYGFRF